MQYDYLILNAGVQLEEFMVIVSKLPSLVVEPEKILRDITDIALDTEMAYNKLVFYVSWLSGMTMGALTKLQRDRLLTKTGDLCYVLIESAKQLSSTKLLYSYAGTVPHGIILTRNQPSIFER